ASSPLTSSSASSPHAHRDRSAPMVVVEVPPGEVVSPVRAAVRAVPAWASANPKTKRLVRTIPTSRRCERSLGRSALHALEVLARALIDLDPLAFVDEERDVDDRAGRERGRLRRAAGRIALHAGLAL